MQQHCEEKKAAAVGRDRLQSPGALALAGIVPVLREWAAPADAYRGHRLWESDSHLSRLHFVCWLLKPQNAFVSILYWYQWWRPGGVFDSVSDQKRKSAVLHISRRIPHRMKDRQRGACSIMFWAEKTKTKKKKNRKPLVQTTGVLWVALYVGIIRWYVQKQFSLFLNLVVASELKWSGLLITGCTGSAWKVIPLRCHFGAKTLAIPDCMSQQHSHASVMSY